MFINRFQFVDESENETREREKWVFKEISFG